jgi:hypothetical protein
LAKLVDDVNQYAPAMYPPTATATQSRRPARIVPMMTRTRPAVATTSASQIPVPERSVVAIVTAGCSNMRLATTAPTTPPATWAATTAARYRAGSPEPRCWTTLTTGLNDAETDPRARISAVSTTPVASAFSRSCNPASLGEDRWAAIPEPMTAATRNPVPTASAVSRRPRIAVMPAWSP